MAYVDSLAGNIEIPEKVLNTGSLGGLLTFRAEDLDKARNTLNQLALSFADAMNQQHEKGFDANGDAGGKLFDIGSPAVTGTAKTACLVRPLRPLSRTALKFRRRIVSLNLTALTGPSPVVLTKPRLRLYARCQRQHDV